MANSAARLIVGISGASGTIYGVRLLELLRQADIETHLVMSRSAEMTLAYETDYKPKDVRALRLQGQGHERQPQRRRPQPVGSLAALRRLQNRPIQLGQHCFNADLLSVCFQGQLSSTIRSSALSTSSATASPPFACRTTPAVVCGTKTTAALPASPASAARTWAVMSTSSVLRLVSRLSSCI